MAIGESVNPTTDEYAMPSAAALAGADAIALLRDIHWTGRHLRMGMLQRGTCISCEQWERDGDADDCKLAALLAKS